MSGGESVFHKECIFGESEKCMSPYYSATGYQVMSACEIEKCGKPYLNLPVHIIENKRAVVIPTLRNLEFIHDFRNVSVIESGKVRALKFNAPSSEIGIADDGSLFGRKHSVPQVTTEKLISNACMLPESCDHFVITVEMLCDEFREWQESTLELIVN